MILYHGDALKNTSGEEGTDQPIDVAGAGEAHANSKIT